MTSNTFRLFVSSTFDDFQRERAVLQELVFPHIKDYCAEMGFIFQPIDLRWGINNEAQLNQKTLEMCLGEVRTCKSYPFPNFLIMIGDRYGWIPLPFAIETKEFERLLTFLNPEAKIELNSWYKKDLNHLPVSYILKERTGAFESISVWNQVEKRLLEILQQAAREAELNEIQQQKYVTSATEIEVVEGIYSYLNTSEFQRKKLARTPDLLEEDVKHVFGFFRNIEKETQSSDKFIREDYKAAQIFKNQVKAELPEDNILECSTQQIDPENLAEAYLEKFSSKLIKFLEAQIEAHRDRTATETAQSIEVELAAQQYFLEQKKKHFTGQEHTLNKIEAYINNKEPSQPLLLYGRSGIGKSAIISKSIEQSLEKKRKVIFRFIGATPDSVYTKELLASIFEELGIDIKRDGLPTNLRTMNPEHLSLDSYSRAKIPEFSKRVEKRFATIKQEVVIFIDALDQLSNRDSFLWIPKQLPANVKLILSVLSNESKQITDWEEEDLKFKAQVGRLNLGFHKKDDMETYFNDLLFRTKNIEFIEDYKTPVQLLNKLLAANHRTIQKHQEDYFLKQFYKSPTPFYIYVAAQEIKNWKSFEGVDEPLDADNNKSRRLADTQLGIVKDYVKNLSRRYHHEKKLVQKVFGYIYASQDGLSENEILELLSSDEEFVKAVAPDTWHENRNKKLPIVIWTRLLEDISPFLGKKNESGETLYYFFHREFEEVISQSSLQKQEHESLILATQQLLKNRSSFYDRWGKLYIHLITNFDILYGANLKAYSIFIAQHIKSDFWLKSYYLDYLFAKGKQFKSYNKEERRHKLSYLLSGTITSEVLYAVDPDKWGRIFMEFLGELNQLYSTIRAPKQALKTAQIAYEVANRFYQKNPRIHTDIYLNCLNDLAWSNRDLNEEKMLDLFKESITLTEELYQKNTEGWAKSHANNLSRLAVVYRSINLEKALFYYKAALNIAEIEYQKNPDHWKKLFNKHLNNYQSFYRYHLTLSDKVKLRLKSWFKRT